MEKKEGLLKGNMKEVLGTDHVLDLSNGYMGGVTLSSLSDTLRIYILFFYIHF